jgi:hypothetical protein
VTSTRTDPCFVAELEPDRASGRSELGRVAEQIDEHALDALEVVHQRHRRFRRGEAEPDRFSLRERLGAIEQAAQLGGQVVLADAQAEPRLLELGQVEQVADQA